MGKTEFSGFALDTETKRRLRRIAMNFEGNVSMTIRDLIRKEYDRITAPQTAAQQEPAQEVVSQ